MEEIADNLFRIKIPLPTIKFLNSYIIRGRERHLIVDTGLDNPECLEAMESALHQLGIFLRDTEFLITHFHRDHSGLLPRLTGKGSRVYFNEPESKMIEPYNFFEHLISYNQKNGFPENRLQSMTNQFSGTKQDFTWEKYPEIIKDGDRIRVGDYLFICLDTPGHSPGHTCLYEPEEKFLLAGDLFFADVTPGIPCLSDRGNPLKEYFESLDKVSKLDVDLVLPGHREPFRKHKERIHETKRFHVDRFDEILNILGKVSLTAFQIASKIFGSGHNAAWDPMSDQQKCLEISQVISQLRYLEEEGLASRNQKGSRMAYTLGPKV